MPKTPRRLTPAQADALIAHLSPAQKRRETEIIIESLRIKGIAVEEIVDAAGRSFLRVDLDQVRAKAPALAEAMEQLQQVMPEPQGHRPGTA
jgi:hypothetical protein